MTMEVWWGGKSCLFSENLRRRCDGDLTKKKEGEDDQTYLARIKRELLVSMQTIDKKLNRDTIYIAYPYGSCNQRVMNICNQVGYKIALTVKRGGNPFFSESLTLKRDQILTKDIETFVTRIKTFQELSLE